MGHALNGADKLSCVYMYARPRPDLTLSGQRLSRTGRRRGRNSRHWVSRLRLCSKSCFNVYSHVRSHCQSVAGRTFMIVDSVGADVVRVRLAAARGRHMVIDDVDVSAGIIAQYR